jgi:hypothetical protein
MRNEAGLKRGVLIMADENGATGMGDDGTVGTDGVGGVRAAVADGMAVAGEA